MKQYHRAALAGIVGLGACKTSSISENNPPQIVVGFVEASAPEDSGAPVIPPAGPWEIELSRSVCYGVCPDYKVVVKSDGTVEYEGHEYVSKRGRATDRVPIADAEALLRKFDQAGFDRLSVPDPCPKGLASDSPTNILAVRRKTGSHVVEHYLGNMCAPPVLADLADAVDKTAKTDRWIKCGKSPSDYCTKP